MACFVTGSIHREDYPQMTADKIGIANSLSLICTLLLLALVIFNFLWLIVEIKIAIRDQNKA